MPANLDDLICNSFCDQQQTVDPGYPASKMAGPQNVDELHYQRNISKRHSVLFHRTTSWWFPADLCQCSLSLTSVCDLHCPYNRLILAPAPWACCLPPPPPPPHGILIPPSQYSNRDKAGHRTLAWKKNMLKYWKWKISNHILKHE